MTASINLQVTLMIIKIFSFACGRSLDEDNLSTLQVSILFNGKICRVKMKPQMSKHDKVSINKRICLKTVWNVNSMLYIHRNYQKEKIDISQLVVTYFLVIIHIDVLIIIQVSQNIMEPKIGISIEKNC